MPPPSDARRLFSPRSAAGLVLSAGLTVWFVWNLRWEDLSKALSEVRLPFVALSCGMLLVEFGLRAVRWKVLLRHMAPLARVGDLFSATVIGAAANTLLPARAGEIAKPLVASRKINVPFASVIATAVLERVYDLLGMVCVLLAMSLVLPDPSGVGVSPEDAVLVTNLKRYGAIAAVVALSGMVSLFLISLRGLSLTALLTRLLAPAPPPARDRVMALYIGFIAGLASVRSPRSLLHATALSLGIWFNGAAAIYSLFQAFQLTLPFGAACFTTVAIAIAVVLPQAPGFFGVFHVAIEKTMVLWSVDQGPAKAFAIVFWAVSFIPVTATGLGVLWREGMSLRGLWSLPAPQGREEREASEGRA